MTLPDQFSHTFNAYLFQVTPMLLKEIEQPLINVDVSFSEPLEKFVKMMRKMYGKQDFWMNGKTKMVLLLFIKRDPPENSQILRTISFFKWHEKLDSTIFCTIRPKRFNYRAGVYYQVNVKPPKDPKASEPAPIISNLFNFLEEA